MRGAIVGLLLFPNVMIVHYSVDWWRSLHQTATITRLDPTIEGTMLFTLMLGIVVFGLLFTWLLVHRFRVGWLEERVGATGLDEALVERRAEAGVTVPTRRLGSDRRHDARRVRGGRVGDRAGARSAAYALYTVRRGRSLAAQVPPEERRWS